MKKDRKDGKKIRFKIQIVGRWNDSITFFSISPSNILVFIVNKQSVYLAKNKIE